MSKPVKIIRLVNGEDVIATVVNQNEKKILIEKPLTLICQPSGNGQINIGLGPFMPYTTDAISLNTSLVVATVTPNEKLVEEYERLHSPIIRPSNSGVVAPVQTAPVGPTIGPTLVKG